MKNPAHPGRIVRSACLEPLGLSITEGARILGVTRQTLTKIANGRSGISAEMAIRLTKAFGSTAETWVRCRRVTILRRPVKPREKSRFNASTCRKICTRVPRELKSCGDSRPRLSAGRSPAVAAIVALQPRWLDSDSSGRARLQPCRQTKVKNTAKTTVKKKKKKKKPAKAATPPDALPAGLHKKQGVWVLSTGQPASITAAQLERLRQSIYREREQSFLGHLGRRKTKKATED
jgi:addiction module HigA family antidote